MQFDYTDFILVWQEKTTKGGSASSEICGDYGAPRAEHRLREAKKTSERSPIVRKTINKQIKILR